MNNIFSLVNQVPAPISTPQGTAPPPSSAAAPVPSAGDSDPGPSNPTSSTHNPEPWNPPPLGETTATSSPVLVLYSRRLTAQTEALYSLLQTSLAEIKVKQEGLTKLLGQGESQVKVLEGVVGEVVGKVGGEGKWKFFWNTYTKISYTGALESYSKSFIPCIRREFLFNFPGVVLHRSVDN
ncbi:hypothetical protein BGX38DRAFT_71588 [Terfezia claveryi]|nr:hypothetical protein BGX38DRAFT_71588 [Terfezia claveryi]